jgi:outer membrane lipoprotein-sorting protein
MKRKFFVVVLMIAVGGLVFAQNPGAGAPSAEELLRHIDNNEIYNTIEYEGEMIIEHGGRRFVKIFKAWARGNTDSFIEFTNPEDRGTKYLRTGGRLFMNSPDTERVMLISGHMLRESMMGSDMSYEDAIDNDTLASRYNAVLAGSEMWNGPGGSIGGSRDCWVLELTAKKRTESYPRRRLLIDKATRDLLRSELFALSGAMLKEQTVLRVEVIAGRRFPVELEMRDLLRRDSRTVFFMKNVVMDRPIADSVFSRRNLER